MKLSTPKIAASACLVAMLAAPAGVLAQHPRGGDPNRGGKPPVGVPEPSTLVMTAVGVALGMGFVLFRLRRNRETTVKTLA